MSVKSAAKGTLAFVLVALALAFSAYVIEMALSSPSRAAEVQPAPEEPKPTPFFISGLQLHNSCGAKQPQCIVYIYGVLDMLIDSLGCEPSVVAGRDMMVGVLSSLATLNNRLDGSELEKLNAAQTVAMAFVTTPEYRACKAVADAPKAGI